jgi:hypothetical protein
VIFWVVAIPIAVLVESGALASLAVQRYAAIPIPQDREVRFRLTPTGVKWVSWSNWDMSWALATPRWIRYLLGPKRTWTVVASEENFRQRSPVIRKSSRLGVRPGSG